MTPEETKVARAFVACGRWVWLPGMRLKEPWIKGWFRLTDGKGRLSVYQFSKRFATYPPRGRESIYPDLNDPATLGCIVRRLEDAWGQPVGIWYPKIGGCCVAVGRLPIGEGYVWIEETEAKALLRALQAAPEAGWVLCPSCGLKGTPFPEEDPVECGNCGHRFLRKEHLTTPEAS